MSQPPFPSPTKIWHADTYDDINPAKNTALSVKGKRVVVTGGGTGVGKAIAHAFAAAGAESIVLLGGRREKHLQQTKEAIEKEVSGAKVEYYVVDIVDHNAVQSAAKKIAKWNVLVLNAGFMADPKPLLQANLHEHANAFTVNIEGTANVVQELLPQRQPDSVVLAVSTAALCVDPKMLLGHAMFAASKLALVKLMEFCCAEMPDCRWVTFHPGAIESDMFDRTGLRGIVPLDTDALAGHFAVWLVSPEASFLNGKFVWSNWDVSELKARAEEIQSSLMLTANILGWPFQS